MTDKFDDPDYMVLKALWLEYFSKLEPKFTIKIIPSLEELFERNLTQTLYLDIETTLQDFKSSIALQFYVNKKTTLMLFTGDYEDPGCTAAIENGKLYISTNTCTFEYPLSVKNEIDAILQKICDHWQKYTLKYKFVE